MVMLTFGELFTIIAVSGSVGAILAVAADFTIRKKFKKPRSPETT